MPPGFALGPSEIYFTPFCTSAGHDAPGQPGHVADRHGIDLHAAAAAQGGGKRELPHQFFPAANAGQQIGVHRIDADLALADGLLELLFLLGRGDGVEILVRHEDFQVPLEPRPGRIIFRLANEFQCPQHVMGLLLGDIGLDVGIADVVVRVHEDIDLPLPRQPRG